MASLRPIAFVVCASILCSVISSAPQFQPYEQVQQVQSLINATTPVAILSQRDEKLPDGGLSSSFEAANGIRQESASFHKTIVVPRLLEDGTETGEQEQRDVIVQTGSWSYTGPDGIVYSLSYIADENGFQPVAEHLPTPPPVPAHIIESLQSQQQVEEQ